MSRRIILIGAGHAGTAAAQELASLRDQGRMDTEITLIDADPHLPYERPSLSKEALTAESFAAPTRHDWAGAGIDFLGGVTATVIDSTARKVTLQDGRRLQYDQLLLAPGGTPRRLNVPGGEHARVLRHLGEARDLHAELRRARELVVIGAGVIGLEVASSASSLGLEVTVVEPGSRPMARSLPSEISDLLTHRHEAAGVTFRFGAGVERINACAGAYRVDLEGGTTLNAELVVAGIGFEPDTALAETAGILPAPGIAVDADGRSSVADIYAAGDATIFPDASGARQSWQTWQHARRHGVHVARRMTGQASEYRPLHWFWTDQQGINLQLLGDPLAATEMVLRGEARGASTRLYLKDGRIVGAVMIDQGRDTRPVTALIESGAIIDADRLADPATQLRALARPPQSA